MRASTVVATNAAAITLLLAAAVSLASQQELLAVVLALTPLATWISLSTVPALARVDAAARGVALVWLLLACSTFVWRVRTTSSLDSNPLDTAAITRVLLVGVAGVLAMGLLLTMSRAPRLPRSMLLLGAYAGIAVLTSITSPEPTQALYRAGELTVGWLAILLAVALLGRRAGAILIQLTAAVFGALLVVVWLEAIVTPSHAWEKTANYSLAPYTLQGYFPQFSSNAIGLLAALVGVWGLAQLSTGPAPRWAASAALIAGVATLLASQYRTGVIGFLLAGIAIMAERARVRALLMVLAVGIVIAFAGVGSITNSAVRIFEKGQPESVSTLDSRTIYWHAAIPAIESRPLLGWGLNVGSRKVLASIGLEDTTTVHSAWVEALLGTGLIGTAMLAGAYLLGIRDAWRGRSDAFGLAALGMLIVLLVRSFTGTSGELFDLPFLALGAAGLGAAAATNRVAAAPATETPW